MIAFDHLLDQFLSLFLHPPCPLCGRSAKTVICPHCERQLHECQLAHPHLQGKDQVPLLVWGSYSGLLKRAIAQLKYEKQWQLAQPLGERLAQTWLQASLFPRSRHPIVIPIPLHPQRQQQRGYNQATLIARYFCQVTGFPLQPNGLQRIKATDPLFPLSLQQRAQQMSHAFSIGKQLKLHQPVILLDDIYTTGTTIKAAQQTLQRAGITVIAVCAIAKS